MFCSIYNKLCPAIVRQLSKQQWTLAALSTSASAYSTNSTNNDFIVRSPFPDVTIPTGLNLYSYITKNFNKYNKAAALVDGVTQTSITFDQFDTETCKISSALRDIGLSKRDVLAIVSPNNIDFPKLFLATMAAGGVVTTCSPLLSPQDLRAQFVDSNTKYIATIPLLLPAIQQATEGLGIKKIIVMEDKNDSTNDKFITSLASMASNSGSKFTVEAVDSRNDPAMLIYTSGTTGKPKGVVHTHYGIIANCCVMDNKELVAVYHEQSCLSLLPFFHIYGLAAILLLTLCTGGTQIILPKFEPTLFLSSIEKHRISFATLAPPLILFLAKHPEVSKYDVSCLESVISGAAPLSENLANEACSRTGISVIRQAYGLSEMASHCMPLKMGMAKPSSVGSPFPNVISRIVDTESGETLGPDQEGELLVKGPNVMKGYWNLPTETANVLDEDGWFSTGDYGYHDNERHLHITDRMKELIKVKGLPVAPAELEGVLLKHPGILDVAVASVSNERLGEAPKAFVVRKDKSLTENDVIDFVKQCKLPEYKWLAGGVAFIDEVPKSAAGKILRRLLK